MLRELLILLAVFLKRLALAGSETAIYLHLLALSGGVQSLQHHPVFTVTQRLLVGLAERTAAEGEVINSIKQVSLTHPVAAHKAIKLGRQAELCLLYIAVVANG